MIGWGEEGVGEEGVGEGTLGGESGISAVFRSPERRSSKTSESRCIQPDGPGCNSPVQRAKHTPFLPSEDGKNPSESTEV